MKQVSRQNPIGLPKTGTEARNDSKQPREDTMTARIWPALHGPKALTSRNGVSRHHHARASRPSERAGDVYW